MTLPSVRDQEVAGKRVLLRADLDVPENEDFRLEAMVPTLKLLSEKEAEIIIIGHRGRPEGKAVEELRVASIKERLQKIAEGSKFEVLENLRFEVGEEANDSEFAKTLSQKGDIYINEAFAASHRAHASIVGLPKLLPHAAGLRFLSELENLSKVLENPKKPVVVIISGIKKDKVEMAKALVSKVDKVLVGGRLPEYIGDNTDSVRLQERDKLVVANLIMDKEDITLNSIDRFKEEIAKAGTIVLAGVLGKYEDEGHRQGTKEIFEAVAASSAFKVAGGGDTQAALAMFNLKERFDWISVGGGAMLEFLAKGTLPGIEALLE
jgi:phosphoglycerate kinase